MKGNTNTTDLRVAEIEEVLNDYTKVPITTGVDLYVSGHVCVLRMVGATTSNIEVPAKYRPSENMPTLGRHKTTQSKYYPCTLVLDATNGKVNGAYFTESSSNSISSGEVTGELFWIIENT